MAAALASVAAKDPKFAEIWNSAIREDVVKASPCQNLHYLNLLVLGLVQRPRLKVLKSVIQIAHLHFNYRYDCPALLISTLTSAVFTSC